MLKNFMKWNIMLLCSFMFLFALMDAKGFEKGEEVYVGGTRYYATAGHFPYTYTANIKYSIEEALVWDDELENKDLVIKNMGMLIYTGLPATPTVYKNVSIYMKHVTYDVSPTTGTIGGTAGLTDDGTDTCYKLVWKGPFEVKSGSNGQWRIFDFSQPFHYKAYAEDGTTPHNISVLFVYEFEPASTATATGSYLNWVGEYTYNRTSVAPHRYRYSTTGTFTTWDGGTGGSTVSYRPFFCFNKADAATPYSALNPDLPLLSNISKYLYFVSPGKNTGTATYLGTTNTTYMYYANAAFENAYTAGELGAVPRVITKMSLFVYSATGAGSLQNNMRIYLANDDEVTLPLMAGAAYKVDTLTKANGGRYTKVWEGELPIKNRAQSQTGNFYYPYNGHYWVEFEFDEPFYYDGKNNLSVVFGTNTGTQRSYYYTYAAVNTAGGGNQYRYVYSAGYDYWQTASTYKLQARFEYAEVDVNNGDIADGKPAGNTSDANAINSEYGYSRSEQIYNASDLGYSKNFSGLSIWYDKLADGSSSDKNKLSNFSILMKDTTANSFTSNNLDVPMNQRDVDYYKGQGYKLVASNKMVNLEKVDEGSWFNIPFDSAYSYTEGKNLDVVLVDEDGSANASSYLWGVYSASADQEVHGAGNTLTANPTVTGISPNKPYMKLAYITSDQQYKSSGVTAINKATSVGASNQEIVRLKITTAFPDAPYNFLKELRVDGKYSNDRHQIVNAKVYYTGSDTMLIPSDDKQFGSDTVISLGVSVDTLVFTGNQELPTGDNYFWVCYDIADASEIDGDSISAAIIDFTLDKYGKDSVYIPDNADPNALRTIFLPLDRGFYRVGKNDETNKYDYQSLAACARAFSQVGITTNTIVEICTNLDETAASDFTVNPQDPDGEFIVTLRPADGVTPVITQTTANTNLLSVLGYANFHIEGANNLTFVNDKGGIPIRYSDTKGVIIKDVTVKGTKTNTIIDLNNTTDNMITNINLEKGKTALNCNEVKPPFEFSNSRIGSTTDTMSVCNGVILTFKNADFPIPTTANPNPTPGKISNNIFTNLTNKNNTSDSVNGLKFVGTNSNDNMYFNCYSNVFNSLNGTQSVYGISLSNASWISFVHNTFIIPNVVSLTPIGTCALIYDDNATATSVRNITLINNIFYNISGKGTNNLAIYHRLANNMFLTDKSNYNIYRGTNGFQKIGTGAAQTFADWQTYWAGITGRTNVDANSVWYDDNDIIRTVSNSDYHLDGPSIGHTELLVPIFNATDIPIVAGSTKIVLPAVTVDIDGDARSTNAIIGRPGMTYAGIDYPKMIAPLEPNGNTLPNKDLCEGDELLFTMDKIFNGWGDNVSVPRTYVPTVHNTWVRNPGTDNDTLNNKETNPDYDVIDPSMYCGDASFKKSGQYYVYSQLGVLEFTANPSTVNIIKPVEFLAQPNDTLACAGSDEISISAELDGSIVALQWQKKTGNNWADVQGEDGSDKTQTLSLVYNPDDVASVLGDYRLKITTTGKCADKPARVGDEPVKYTDVAKIGIAYPLDEAVANLTVDDVQVPDDVSGICTGTKLSFNVDASGGTILAYQWQKFDPVYNDFVDVQSKIYPSALTANYVIPSSASSDAGKYRCKVIGASSCGSGAEIITVNEITVGIIETSTIVHQPQAINACSFDTARFVAVVSDKTGSDNTYQWYKDGQIIDGATSAILAFYDINKVETTDTEGNIVITYDTVSTLAYDKAGIYQLSIGYTNCQGERDVQYSEAVPLYVYGLTEIVSQTNQTYGFEGGYSKLSVSAETKGTDQHPETYQWYRYVDGYVEKLNNNTRMSGCDASLFVISPLLASDINDLTRDDYYYCVVTGLCQSDTTSAKILIKSSPKIDIITEPESLSICGGVDAEFTVEVKANDPNDPIVYQWYKNNVALVDGGRISGVNSNTLTITNADKSDTGSYHVAVSYKTLGAGILSTTATLSVEVAPVLTKDLPDTTKVDENKPVVLSITVESQYPSYACNYEWYKDGVAIPLSNDPFYNISNATKADEGKYHVVVTSMNGCGATTSKETVLEVETVSITENTNSFGIISVNPNPLSSSKAEVLYFVEMESRVKLSIIDLQGVVVSTIYDNIATSGQNNLQFDVSRLSSGKYYLQLENNGKKVSYSIVIAK